MSSLSDTYRPISVNYTTSSAVSSAIARTHWRTVNFVLAVERMHQNEVQRMSKSLQRMIIRPCPSVFRITESLKCTENQDQIIIRFLS